MCAHTFVCVCAHTQTGHHKVKPVHKIRLFHQVITQTKKTIGIYYNCIRLTMSQMWAFNMAAKYCFLDINDRPLVQSDQFQPHIPVLIQYQYVPHPPLSLSPLPPPYHHRQSILPPPHHKKTLSPFLMHAKTMTFKKDHKNRSQRYLYHSGLKLISTGAGDRMIIWQYF